MLSNIQNSKEYEALVFDRDIYKDSLLLALKEVRQFIIDEKLILTGGMAIDFALREKGTQLYPDDALPDYDFYSPDFNHCAYKIGKKLCDIGLPNISIITAYHPTTMRVRVEFVAVADITYIPRKIFDNIPTMKTPDGLLYEHPCFKFMNIHRALSYPLENPPMEVILHRWAKDICRFDLLYGYYPITPKSLDKEPKFVKTDIIDKNKKEICLAGFSALAYWLGKKDNIYMLEKYGEKSQLSQISIVSDDPNSFLPASGGKAVQKTSEKKSANDVSLSALQKEGLGSKTNKRKTNKRKTKIFSELLDNTSGRIEYIKSGNKVEILDNRGRLLSSYYDSKNKFYVANLQFLMCQFLSMFFLYDLDKEDKKVCLWAYKKCEKLVSNANPKTQPELYPTVETYGSHNLSKSYVNGKHMTLMNIGEMGRDGPPVRPVNVYPKKKEDCKIPGKISNFDISQSWLFDIDGSEIEELMDITTL